MQYLWILFVIMVVSSLQVAFAEEYTVTIPFGAYDPNRKHNNAEAMDKYVSWAENEI